MRKIFIFVFLILFSGFLFATDYYVSDIVLPKTVIERNDFNANIVLVNNSSSDQTLDLNIQLYSPEGIEIYTGTEEQQVSSNSTYNLELIINGEDTNASTVPYILKATITNSDDSPSNNSYNGWFVVTKATQKIPIPDMPVYFGFIIALITITFIIAKKDKK